MVSVAILLQAFTFGPAPVVGDCTICKASSQPNRRVENGPDKVVTTQADLLKFFSIANHLNNNNVESKNLSVLFLDASNALLGTPYVSNTLEANDEEKLVVNLQGVDCVTLVEYSLAIALALKKGDGSFEDFVRFLTCIRYRKGIIDGYPSRLHYFTEWLFEKKEAGLLEIVNDLPGSKPHNPKVRFMTSKPHLYKQLDNKDYLEEMAMIEANIASIEMNFIPKEKLKSLEGQVSDGDIIAFVSSIEGLDVSHTGIAMQKYGRLFLLHTSTRSNQVEVSPVPLVEYLNPSRNVVGILVGRLLD